jgi:hypothetical protein
MALMLNCGAHAPITSASEATPGFGGTRSAIMSDSWNWLPSLVGALLGHSYSTVFGGVPNCVLHWSQADEACGLARK